MAIITISGKEGLKDLSAAEFAVEISKVLKGNNFNGEKVNSIYFKNGALVIETWRL